MQILFSYDLILLGCTIVLAWALTRFWVLPSARRAVTGATSANVAGAGARYGLATALANVLDAMLIAVVIVSAGSAAMQWHLSRLTTGESPAASVLAVRDQVEQVLERTAGISAEVWIATLLLLALIWLLAARSASRRRWSQAVDARRSALGAALETLSGEELRSRARAENADAVDRLERTVETLAKTNKAQIRAAMATPMLQIGDDATNRASLGDLLGFEIQLRRDADAAEVGGDNDRAAQLRSAADGLRARFTEIAGHVNVTLGDLDGQFHFVGLLGALADNDPLGPVALSAAREIALRKLIVDEQLARHAALGASKTRREPELIREWLAAGATSEATVRTSSFVGRVAARMMLVALLVGCVGLGVKQMGSVLVAQATALELQIGAQAGQQELLAAMAGSAKEQAPSDAPLASDEATVQALHYAFRSNVAQALRQNLGAPRLLAARDHFELGSLEARRRILAASARAAAPNPEPNRAAQVFRPSRGSHVRAAAPGDLVAVLDNAVDRRIAALRQNENLWTRLRAAVARPAPADLAAEAFLRTAFVQKRVWESPIMRAWAEGASYQFAAEAARTGRPPAPGELHLPAFNNHPLLTVRDRRLVGDYTADAPHRVAAVVDDVHAGRIDPGSLHRELPGAHPLPGAGGSRAPYSEYFPPTQPPSGGGAPWSSGGSPGAGPRPGGGGRVAAAAPARSYARIRFSGRIGGVLIGVGPSPGGDTLDLRDITWSMDGSQVRIILADAAGNTTALGPFHAAIVHHALAYAADGRVVTTTMPLLQMSKDGSTPARRVLVHPAIEDTRFACRTIDIDRFVDGFTGSDERVMTVRTAVTILGSLLVKDLGSAIDQKDIEGAVELIARHAKSCGTGERCFPIESYSRYGLDYGGAASFLACLASAQDGMSCLGSLKALPSRSGFHVDSGVRETAFKLDRQLAFLTGADNGGNPLWPLDFMIQAVPQTRTGEDVNVKSEWEPWTFPSIDRLIREDVRRGVAATPRAANILEEMRAFTVLQRLFRLALAGDLGLQLPLDRLVRLQEATAGFVKVERNDRWNMNRPLLEALVREHDALAQDVLQLTKSPSLPALCQAAADAALRAATSQTWPEKGEGLWPMIGRVEHSCRGTPVGYQLTQTLGSLRSNDLIDEAISFARQMKAPRQTYACSPL